MASVAMLLLGGVPGILLLAAQWCCLMSEAGGNMSLEVRRTPMGEDMFLDEVLACSRLALEVALVLRSRLLLNLAAHSCACLLPAAVYPSARQVARVRACAWSRPVPGWSGREEGCERGGGGGRL